MFVWEIFNLLTFETAQCFLSYCSIEQSFIFQWAWLPSTGVFFWATAFLLGSKITDKKHKACLRISFHQFSPVIKYFPVFIVAEIPFVCGSFHPSPVRLCTDL